MKNKDKKKKKPYTPWHKQKRHIVGKIFSRTTLIILLFILQIALFVLAIYFLSSYFYTYFIITYFISLLLIFIILPRDQEQTYKIAWIVVIVIFPIIGAIIYTLVQIDFLPRKFRKAYQQKMDLPKKYLKPNEKNLEELKKIDPHFAGAAQYLQDSPGFPIYKGEGLKYYPSGEAAFDDVLNALRSATKFINIEFFIVKDGIFWKAVEEILVEKAKNGVEVRLLYDGLNEMFNLPRRFPKMMKAKGIQTHVFAPAKSSYPHRENYRNHRKSIIVDGRIGFVGGLNLADEYINKEVRFGYWKDAVMKIEGEATNPFTVMFFTMWDLHSKKEFDISPYLVGPKENEEDNNKISYIIPYGDAPFNDDPICYKIYLEIINKATKYVYISSPYLVLTREFSNALIYAAQRGVDVRLLTPGIPDKKIPFMVARTYYKKLIKNGIKIYEYTPGFNHSKLFVSDDLVFTVGSTNLDYRSFFLSFENGVYGFDKDLALTIKDDLLKAYSESHFIDLEAYKKFKLGGKFVGQIFRIFIPLL